MSFRAQIVLTSLMAIGIEGALSAQEKRVQFNRDIRPILSENCFKCHGPDKDKRKAKLRLDVADVAYAARDEGTPVVPHKPEQSMVVERILSDDPDDVMPPPKTGKRLTAHQKELLQEWIRQGAVYEGHWAFVLPVRPMLPAADSGWCRNPIDYFISSRLQAEKLRPATEADRRTLIRRVTLDLTGLPPKPEDVEDFVRTRDPYAYEKLVRRLLQSPRFGERMAVHWLDLVRYADTVGFHGDMPVNVWAYRDYVIRAFNDNMPFDQFTREQLAGDLLPNATRWQRIASAYNRLNRMSTEGGIQDKEYRAKYAGDRVRTTSATWLGATIGCAECHDHKFDPFSTKDFYRFAAFFADLKEKGYYEAGFREGNWGPAMPLGTDKQFTALERLEERLEKLKRERERITDEALAPGRQAWEQMLFNIPTNKLEWKTQRILSAKSTAGADLQIESNQIVHAEGPSPDNDTYVITFRPGAGEFTGLRLDTLMDESLPGNRVARGGITFILTEINIRADGDRVAIAHATADANDLGHPIFAAFDGKAHTGWGMRYGHSKEHFAAFTFARPLRATSNTVVKLSLHQDSPMRRATIGKFKLSLSSVPNPTYDRNGLPDDLWKAIREPIDKRSADQQQKLAAFYRRAATELQELHRKTAVAEAERSLLLADIPAILVSEATVARTTRVLPRGDWMNDSGEVVAPGVPQFLKQLEAPGGRATRVELADWLASADNPLTARAVVNRFWKLFFGAGFSRTLDDLGAQGEWPTHPELLDWLAVEFRESGWNVKHIIELIVTSATYRQSSGGNKLAEERDPQNRLCARQARLRLEAEFVRDNALSISGLLVNKLGGPSVFPYQPEGYWAPLNFPKREYVLDNDENLHRRGVYVHWQRTFLHPSLVAFDASPREECAVARPISNTPLQALVLLNDPNFVEAAQAFARNIQENGGRSVEKRIDWAYRRALARPARSEEVRLLAELYRKQLDRRLEERNESAEMAAWTAVARAILNLHETITRY